MRNIFGFGVVLAVFGLMTADGTAYGQAGGGRGAGGAGNSASRVVNDVQQGANAAGVNPVAPDQTGATTVQPGATTTVPTTGNQAIGTAGNVLNPAGTTVPTTGNQAAGTPGTVINPGGTTAVPTTGNQAIGTAGNVLNPAGTPATPGTNYQVPGTAGNVLNQTGIMPTGPGNAAVGGMNPAAGNATTYSSNYYQPGVQQGTTAATPGYTNQVMPGMTGYNSVNPMGTTMTPGSYYAGTAGTPYARGATTGYSSMYVTPGYYTTQPGTYAVQQRRGLFGGIFRRRNRVVYPSTPYGYTTSGYNTYSGPVTYTTSP